MGASTDYKNLFPVEKEIFEIDGKVWTARVKNEPDGSQGDGMRYSLEFWRQDFPSRVRQLSLWVSEAGLSMDTEQKYREALFSLIRDWLEGDQPDGELTLFG
jgi:hypothetical protein